MRAQGAPCPCRRTSGERCAHTADRDRRRSLVPRARILDRRPDRSAAAAVAELVRVSPAAEDLGHRFAAAGHQLHLVGGSVRDAMLGRLGDDLDFATDARPEQVLALAAGWADAIWQTGVAFGTVGLQRRGVRLEITTYRSESYRPDSRHPEVVYGDTLVGDLGRRPKCRRRRPRD